MNYVKKMNYTKYEVDENLDKIIKFDKSLCELTGYTKDEIENITYKDLIPDEDLDNYFQTLDDELVKNKKDELYLEHRLKRKDGSKIFVLCLGHKNFNSNNEVISSTIRVFNLDQTLAMLKKEKEVEDMHDKVETLEHDELTGLLRREPFINLVNKKLKEKESFSFMMVDIDDFKKINDTHGHMLGDEVLKKASEIFKNLTKDVISCRLGGDEFAILLPNVNKEEEAILLASRLKQSINELEIKKDLKVGISIGITLVKENSKYDFKKLYKKTDKVLYISKNNGKNSYTICE